MQRRTFAKTLVGALVVSPALPAPAPVTPALPFAMEQEVRWLNPPTDMPTVGRIIGLQQRFVGTELEELRCHIDFGTTKLWLGSHELESV